MLSQERLNNSIDTAIAGVSFRRLANHMYYEPSESMVSIDKLTLPEIFEALKFTPDKNPEEIEALIKTHQFRLRTPYLGRPRI